MEKKKLTKFNKKGLLGKQEGKPHKSGRFVSPYVSIVVDKTNNVNPIELINSIRTGVSKKRLNNLLSIFDIKAPEFFPIIHIQSTKFSELKEDDILTSEQTEKTVQLAQLYEIGERVFGDIEKFNYWLRKENQSLGGEKPINLLDTSIGFQIVSDELLRIEHGVFA